MMLDAVAVGVDVDKDIKLGIYTSKRGVMLLRKIESQIYAFYHQALPRPVKILGILVTDRSNTFVG